jgi:hypothetical protein
MQDLISRPARALRADAGPLLFVWSIWLVQSLLLLRFALRYSVDIPFLDDWEMVPVLTGRRPVTLEWLWSQHNEHRIAIPRLLYLALLKLGGYDFRAGVVFDVLVLSATAAALSTAARAIRGRTLYSDAFFPLVLLHWGQAENLVWGFTIPLVLGSALATCLLCVLMRPGLLSFRAALPLALCTLALPLISASGLALVPALAAITVLAGCSLRRARPSPRWAWMSLLAAGLLGIGVLLLYFIGYHRPPGHLVSPSLGATLKATLQVLSLGFGSRTREYWPLSGAFVAALIVATVLALLWVIARSREERPRALRAALFLGGMGCLAGGIGWARIAMYPEGIFASRYATLAAPLLCCLYFAWEVVQRPQAVRFVQMLLFFVSAVLVVGNHDSGVAEATGLQQLRQPALADLQNGVPLADVAQRHCGAIYVCGTNVLVRRMRMLRNSKIGAFAYASDEDPLPQKRKRRAGTWQGKKRRAGGSPAGQGPGKLRRKGKAPPR